MSKTLQFQKKFVPKKITAEQTIIIIRLIKKYRCIWDANHPDFRNRQIRNNAFQKIGSYFKLSGEHVREKYRRFRNNYRQELKYIRERKKSHTSLFYFDEMDFLRDQIEEQTLIDSSFRADNDVLPSDYNIEINEFPMDSLDDSYTEGLGENEFCNNDLIHSNQVVAIEAAETNAETPTRIESDTIEETGICLDSDAAEENTICLDSDGGEEYAFEEIGIGNESKSPPSQKGDEFDAFAGYLASQLREMDELSALETMEEMQRIIFKRRIQILKKNHLNARNI